ncbi:TPA: hypothetical protein DF272_05195 [Candidatus Falkowbacteria bacterium]|nr:hypothetical protein [Candidatus Falkowbacteria bacterium]
MPELKTPRPENLGTPNPEKRVPERAFLELFGRLPECNGLDLHQCEDLLQSKTIGEWVLRARKAADNDEIPMRKRDRFLGLLDEVENYESK